MKTKAGLGTFEGVFTPTILTILGVIMYLRLGWVVGNAGLLGAISIILIAHIITISTTLSMSSMLTNIKIGAGGAYAIVSRSLGLEMGGAIGIPLYISQAISVSFYITGFTELWISFFPHHSPTLINFTTWLVLTCVTMLSAKLAFRIQYFVLFVVFASIVSFLAGDSMNSGQPVLLGQFTMVGYWETFAIFFPAVTGILAGVSMSGELRDPRKNIVKGTAAAVFSGFIVYLVLAYWFARQAGPDLLLSDTSIILKLAWSKPLIIAGIMGAVLSSALSTLVSAPRTMAALAENRSILFSGFLAKKASNNEPRNAIIISSILSLAVLLTSNLNSLAELLTLFFLTTYAMINMVVFLEQAIGIISFRPRLSISILVPVIGVFSCVFAMILINRFFTLITFSVVIFIYYILSKRHLISPQGDVRGGVFTAMTEWAAQKAMSMPYHPRLWKPSIVIPVEKPEDFRRVSRFIHSLISPSGRVYYLTIKESCENKKQQLAMIEDALLPLKENNLFAHSVFIEGGKFNETLSIIFQSMLSTFLPPNTAFFTISDDAEKQQKFSSVLDSTRKLKMGLMCLYLHPKYGFGQEKHINLWLRDKSPNTDLAVLTALQLMKNWNANLYLMRVVDPSEDCEKIKEGMQGFIDDARLPINTQIKVMTGNFDAILCTVSADLNIFGMPSQYESMLKTIKIVQGSVLFVADSGLESALV